MLGDGRHVMFRDTFLRKYFQNLAFGQERVVQRDFDDLCMALAKNGSCDTRRTAASKRQLLTYWKLWQAGEDDFLGYALDIRGRRGKQAQAHQI